MAVTWADVIAIEPLAADVDAAARTIFLDTAALLVDVDEWGALYDKGVLYMAAHLGLLSSWSVSGAGGAVGPVVSESLGPMSRSYANLFQASASEGALGTTKWGKIYLSLLNTQVGAFVP